MFAHTLEAPLAEAPMEVRGCAPELARRDARDVVAEPTSGFYADIRAAADIEWAASALAHRARFLVRLDGAAEELTSAQLLAAMESVRNCSRAHGAALCRTWLGGWATSHRTQRGWKPCPFGCFAPAANDALPHLMGCPVLWGAVSSAVGITPAPSYRRRAGLIGSDAIRSGRGTATAPPASVLLLTIATDVYHRTRLRGRRALAGAAAGAVVRLAC